MTDTIYWALVDSSPNALEDGKKVLSPAELDRLSGMRFTKRRDEWLLGRWAAKSLVKSIPSYQHFSADELEIDNTPEGMPYILLPSGSISPDCLSISHRDRHAFCALTLGPAIKVGADLEKIEPHPDSFVEDFFTPAEQELVGSAPARERDLVATLIWSVKEAMLKALGVGLHWDTRRVEIGGEAGLLPDGNAEGEWHAIPVGDPQDKNRRWAAWWRRRGDFLMTLAGFSTGDLDLGATQLVEKGLRM